MQARSPPLVLGQYHENPPAVARQNGRMVAELVLIAEI